jgi:hypothetical protein
VHITAMLHSMDDDDIGLIVDLVDDPVVTPAR